MECPSNSRRLQYRFNTDVGTSLYDICVSYSGTSAQPRFTLRALANVVIKIEDGPKPFPYSSIVRSPLSHPSPPLTLDIRYLANGPNEQREGTTPIIRS